MLGAWVVPLCPSSHWKKIYFDQSDPVECHSSIIFVRSNLGSDQPLISWFLEGHRCMITFSQDNSIEHLLADHSLALKEALGPTPNLCVPL